MQIEIDIPTEQLQVDIPASQVQVDIPSQQVQVNVPAAKIVASGSFLNQTSNLSPTTVFTSSSSGLFRVNAYFTKTPSSFWGPAVEWNDGEQAQTSSIPSYGSGSSSIVYVGEDQSIQLSVFTSQPSGSFNLRYSVEEL